ncbi:MAG: hypothetical protein VX681_16205, partial [Myxococcota bacterium]|nr:hypothetical protein [Myxococcota bacterium]
ATELAVVGLPGMTNFFSPISAGTTIDNGAGLVTLFDEATLATGLVGGNVRTLGSVTFQVVNGPDVAMDSGVIASVQNPGIDSLSLGTTVYCLATNPTGCDFVGASVTPEPAAAVLGAVALATLLGLKRRRR